MVNLNTSFLKKKDIILTEKGLKLKLLPQNPNKADSASSSLNTTKQESWGLVLLSGTKGWKLSEQLLAVSYFLCLLLPPCLPAPAAVKYSSHLNLTLSPVISSHLFWVSLHNRSEQDVITHNPVCCCIAPPFSRALERDWTLGWGFHLSFPHYLTPSKWHWLLPNFRSTSQSYGPLHKEL